MSSVSFDLRIFTTLEKTQNENESLARKPLNKKVLSGSWHHYFRNSTVYAFFKIMDGVGNRYILLWKDTENVLLLNKERKEHKNIKSPLKITPPSLAKFILHVRETRNIFIFKKTYTCS